MDCYLLYDVGGTNVKVVSFHLVNKEGVPNTIFTYEAKSKDSREVILQNYLSMALDVVKKFKYPELQIVGVGMAFPGPFDYENGISLVRGIDKYDSIYGVNIQRELINLLKHSRLWSICKDDIPIVFVNDVEAFALGAIHYGMAKGADRAMYLCIGTGAGSAFTEGRDILKEPKDNVPHNGWIYSFPFRDSIIDDYISARDLCNIALDVTGEKYDGKEISKMAESGNSLAYDIFCRFGENLKEAIVPFIEDIRPDTFVLGAQISKSFQYFCDPLLSYCKERNIKFFVSQNTSSCIFDGLSVTIRNKS